MRRIVIALVLSISACSSGAAAPTSTSTEPPGDRAAAPGSQATAPAAALCRSITSDLDEYLDGLQLSRLAGSWQERPGPFSADLADPVSFAAELALDCAGEFAVTSQVGEMVDVVAAWDDDKLFAIVRGLAARPEEPEPSASAVVLPGGAQTRLDRVDDDLSRGVADTPLVSWSLSGFVALAGDDPLAALAAWTRATDPDGPYEMLRLSAHGGWGSGPDIADFTLYSDGTLLTPATGAGYAKTFSHGAAVYGLSPAEVAGIEAMALATGIVDGERFELPDQAVIDAGSLGLALRYDDVTHVAGLYNPSAEEATPARQRLVDLESHLKALVRTKESTRWIPETVLIKVDPHGSYSDSNTLDWPGSFDLEVAAQQGCTLLHSDQARDYLADVALIGDDYQDRHKTIFEYNDKTYSVQAIMVLSGSAAGRAEDLPPCGSAGVSQSDPDLSAWLWEARQTTSYQLEFVADCSACDEPGALLDGSTAVVIPGWGELTGMEDVFDLARRDDLVLTGFVTDGIVGLPLLVELSNPDGGERLTIKTVSFSSDAGTLRVEHESDGIRLDQSGFEEWLP